MLVIGAVDNSGVVQAFSNYAGYVRLYAPGRSLEQPYWSSVGQQSFYYDSGTSHCTCYYLLVEIWL